MKTSQTIAVLDAALDADIPTFLWGAPGIGKSDIVRQVAARRSLPLVDLRAVLLDPVDLRGLPSVQDGRAIWNPMGALPDAARDGDQGILFLDELNAAPPSVQAACFGLVLDRKLGEYHLPAGWRVVAAGNRQSDRAAAQRMPSALGNRFLHIDVDVDMNDWCRWALGVGRMPAALVAFLRFRPELLHQFLADRIINPTPRTWAMAAKIVESGLDPETELLALAGIVGEGPAAELIAFLRIYRSLPNPDGIILHPDSAAVPDDPATLYALMSALARRASEQTFSAITRYLTRVRAEFSVLCVRDAIARDKRLETTHAYTAWVSANSDVIF